MQEKPEINQSLYGLSDEEVIASRLKTGLNELKYAKESAFSAAVKRLLTEPMVVLLMATATLYFINGNAGDGIFMAAAIVLISIISLYQDSRSRNALEKLKSYTQASIKVIRNGKTIEIKSEELVVGDNMIVEEGISIPADGTILQSNDFSVDESLLTGESLSVYKDKSKEEHFVYSGTTVTSGLAVAVVTATGNETKLGKIGKSLEGIREVKTPLEKKIGDFVKKMVIAGVIVFMVVWFINYFSSFSITDSFIKALTLAMSILPEEIPVAFTTFMAVGAWRLMKKGIVVKQMKTVETLGSATVICTDKTGTITENKMSIAKVHVPGTSRFSNPAGELTEEERKLIQIAMWASEPIPFDPMEIAIHASYAQLFLQDERPQFRIIHEYPLGGQPPMMTHIFSDAHGHKIIAAKGAPEALIKASRPGDEEKRKIEEAFHRLAAEGYRVLGIGLADDNGKEYPQNQEDFNFSFLGLLAFYDPPKKNMKRVLDEFYEAGIKVKIVTGDNALTTTAIAKQIGFRGYEDSMSGDELMSVYDAEGEERILNANVFTRMYPEAKLKLIDLLKSRQQIVAMTGDGVNDGPALKAAHIGIAMGKRGAEIARQAASLILTDDDLSRMIDAIAMGRKIYSNLKKAIQYIISIHIPIILTVFIPLATGWVYPFLFSPLHIIFLELIMGPTCSIIYENEPIEKNTMRQGPRPYTETFFNYRELLTSILQGLVITAGTLGIYQYAIFSGLDENSTRTMVFLVLISANVFLTLVNRSFHYSILTTIKYRNPLVPLIILITLALTVTLIYFPPLAQFFAFEQVSLRQAVISIGAGFLSVIWYEAVKWKKRNSEAAIKPEQMHARK